MATPPVQITPQQFTDAGLDDWRVLWWQAFAVFETGDFATGLAFVNEVGRLAEAADHHPDIALRYPRVELRLATHSTMSLTDKDVALAREISAAAAALGVPAAPASIRTWEFALDAVDVDAVRDFWCAVLGYERAGDTDIVDPLGLYPPVYVQQMDAPRSGRNRIHIDLGLPPELAEERVAAAVAAGGTVVNDEFAPMWWTLADPEGNEVDIATWVGRD